MICLSILFRSFYKIPSEVYSGYRLIFICRPIKDGLKETPQLKPSFQRLRFPNINKAVDAVNLYGEYTSNCRIDGEAIAGGNSEAKIESMKEWQNLLRKVFQLH
jgi:hypothetical protein